MRIITLLITFVLSTSAFALGTYRTLSIPAKDIIEAAKKIKLQTNPGYVVDGELACAQISQEVPPLTIESVCTITVDGKKELIQNAEKIIAVLKLIKPATGPAYSFKSDFSATSISQEVPPYRKFHSASVKLSVFVPAKNILIATRKIQYQTGPAYYVKGQLECSQMSQEVPPYTTESSCFVEVDGSREEINSPLEVIESLKKIKPMTGPTYHFKGEFLGISITQEVPPFKVKEDVEVKLYE